MDVGRREDRFLDHISSINGRLKMLKVQIELYREGPLTENELLMLDTFSRLIDDKEFTV